MSQVVVGTLILLYAIPLAAFAVSAVWIGIDESSWDRDDLSFARTQRQAAFILMRTASIIGWPVAYCPYPRRPPDYFLRSQLRGGIDLLLSVYFLGLSIVLVLSTYLAGLHWYQLAFFVAIVVANAARQSVGIFGYQLVTRLKQSRVDPRALFATIAVADFITLTIAATVISQWPHSLTATMSPFVHEAPRLLALGHASQVIHVRRVPGALLLAAAAIILYSQILSQALKLRAYRRNTDEYVDVVQSLLRLDRRTDAIKFLNKIEYEEEKDEQLWKTRCLVALLKNDIDAASKHARVLAVILDAPDDRKGIVDDSVTLVLQSWVQILLPDQEVEDLLEFATSRGISDGCLQSFLLYVKNTKNLNQIWTSFGRLGRLDERFPLSEATMHPSLANARSREDGTAQMVAKAIMQLEEEGDRRTDAICLLLSCLEEDPEALVGGGTTLRSVLMSHLTSGSPLIQGSDGTTWVQVNAATLPLWLRERVTYVAWKVPTGIGAS